MRRLAVLVLILVAQAWSGAALAQATCAANFGGIYLSQLSQGDPRAQVGGTGAVFLIVVQNCSQFVATVNAEYRPTSASAATKVWSYAIVDLGSDLQGTAAMVDSFGVCNVSLRFKLLSGTLSVTTLSSQPIAGAANPNNLNCQDIYPTTYGAGLPFTRDFTRIY